MGYVGYVLGYVLGYVKWLMRVLIGGFLDQITSVLMQIYMVWEGPPTATLKKNKCRSDASSKGTLATMKKICEPCQIKKDAKDNID
jgi:hypothetical protein